MSFEELMEMQENTVRSHPETTFVIAHVGSYAENLEWVSGQLEKYPNMYIDVAARLAELGRVPYSAKKIFCEASGSDLVRYGLYAAWYGIS